MKQWILRKNATSVNDLIMQEVPLPEPRVSEVRVKNYAVSLNYRDVSIMKGIAPMGTTRDIIPCSDGAGVIDAIGDTVENWKIGDKVVSQCYRGWPDGRITAEAEFFSGLGANNADGTLAEYFIIKADQIVRVPQSLSYVEAATLPCAGTTAWTAINGNRPYPFRLQKFEKVLILGTGGVSTLAITIAVGAETVVYCTTSQDEKIEALKKMGVKDVVNYRTNSNWGDIVFEKTGGVDLVVNTVGMAALDQAIRALGLGGRVSMISARDNDGMFTESAAFMFKNNIIFGVLTSSTEAFNDFVRFIDDKSLKPYIQKIYDFANAREAYQEASLSNTFGKIVIQINHEN